MLEEQAAFLPVRLANDDHDRCHEPDDVEVIGQLRGVPDLSVLGFQVLPGAGLGIDLGDHLIADVSVGSVIRFPFMLEGVDLAMVSAVSGAADRSGRYNDLGLDALG